MKEDPALSNPEENPTEEAPAEEKADVADSRLEFVLSGLHWPGWQWKGSFLRVSRGSGADLGRLARIE